MLSRRAYAIGKKQHQTCHASKHTSKRENPSRFRGFRFLFQGMERKDLLAKNAGIFKEQGLAIAKVGKKDTRGNILYTGLHHSTVNEMRQPTSGRGGQVGGCKSHSVMQCFGHGSDILIIHLTTYTSYIPLMYLFFVSRRSHALPHCNVSSRPSCKKEIRFLTICNTIYLWSCVVKKLKMFTRSSRCRKPRKHQRHAAAAIQWSAH